MRGGASLDPVNTAEKPPKGDDPPTEAMLPGRASNNAPKRTRWRPSMVERNMQPMGEGMGWAER